MPISKSVSLVFRMIGLAALSGVAVLACTESAMGQPKGAPDPSAPPAAPSLEFPEEGTLSLTNLDVASQEMRALLKKMRVVAIKYHLSDSPRDARDLATEWRKMLAGGHKIHDKLVEGAIEAFREKPNLEGKAGTLLMSVAGRNATMDRFENMLEVVQLLKQHGAASKQFDLYFGLTAAGNNEFALAKPHLESVMVNLENDVKELAKTDKIAEDERKSFAEKMFETYELAKDLAQADVYEPLWQEELKAREADAAGEPLPRVLLETTKGDVVIELFENNAPNTVANFITLVEQGFYDGLPFHRVLPHFMAQGGDPARDGSGGPGYCIPTELEGKTHRNFFRGTVGMALSGQPDSGGSQFFICYLPRAHLNGKYVAFGRVVEGMNIVGDLARINPEKKDEQQEGQQSWPDDIISAKVLNKRDHEYKVIKLPAPKPQPSRPKTPAQ